MRLTTYAHPEHDIRGKWNPETCESFTWFPHKRYRSELEERTWHQRAIILRHTVSKLIGVSGVNISLSKEPRVPIIQERDIDGDPVTLGPLAVVHARFDLPQDSALLHQFAQANGSYAQAAFPTVEEMQDRLVYKHLQDTAAKTVKVFQPVFVKS